MRRQLDELNRSVTIIIWYKVSLSNVLERTFLCYPDFLKKKAI